jgi:hypothetical protein
MLIERFLKKMKKKKKKKKTCLCTYIHSPVDTAALVSQLRQLCRNATFRAQFAKVRAEHGTAGLAGCEGLLGLVEGRVLEACGAVTRAVMRRVTAACTGAPPSAAAAAAAAVLHEPEAEADTLGAVADLVRFLSGFEGLGAPRAGPAVWSAVGPFAAAVRATAPSRAELLRAIAVGRARRCVADPAGPLHPFRMEVGAGLDRALLAAVRAEEQYFDALPRTLVDCPGQCFGGSTSDPAWGVSLALRGVSLRGDTDAHRHDYYVEVFACEVGRTLPSLQPHIMLEGVFFGDARVLVEMHAALPALMGPLLSGTRPFFVFELERALRAPLSEALRWRSRQHVTLGRFAKELTRCLDLAFARWGSGGPFPGVALPYIQQAASVFTSWVNDSLQPSQDAGDVPLLCHLHIDLVTFAARLAEVHAAIAGRAGDNSGNNGNNNGHESNRGSNNGDGGGNSNGDGNLQQDDLTATTLNDEAAARQLGAIVAGLEGFRVSVIERLLEIARVHTAAVYADGKALRGGLALKAGPAGPRAEATEVAEDIFEPAIEALRARGAGRSRVTAATMVALYDGALQSLMATTLEHKLRITPTHGVNQLREDATLWEEAVGDSLAGALATTPAARTFTRVLAKLRGREIDPAKDDALLARWIALRKGKPPT